MSTKLLVFLGIILLSKQSLAQQRTALIPRNTITNHLPNTEANEIDFLLRVSDLQPTDTTLALKVAQKAMANKDTLKSIVYYQRALSNGAKGISIFQKLSDLYKGANQHKEALLILDKSLEVYPNNIVLLTQKTSLLLASTSLDDLIKKYKSKLKDESVNKSEVNQILTILYRNSNQSVQAGDMYFETLQKGNTQSFNTNYQMAAYYYNQAVEIKKASDRMDYITYQREGIEVEKKAFEKFRESIKYFEKAYLIQKNEDIKNSLVHLYTLLKIKKEEWKL